MHKYDQLAQIDRPYYGEGVEAGETRTTHVAAALFTLDEDGQQLIEAIHELGRRLSDVLRLEVDSPENTVGEPRHGLVPLAERLTSHGGIVRMARQHVASILDRLEL